MFFDDYDRFRTTSTTATSATRLNLRHQAMASLIRNQPDGTVRAVRDYHTGNRVTLRCRTR